jgi:hypothetical protein
MYLCTFGRRSFYVEVLTTSQFLSVLRFRDVDPGSEFFPARIPDPHQEYKYLNLKNCSRKMIRVINPGSGSWATNPGSRGQKGTGSVTLFLISSHLSRRRGLCGPCERETDEPWTAAEGGGRHSGPTGQGQGRLPQQPGRHGSALQVRAGLHPSLQVSGS